MLDVTLTVNGRQVQTRVEARTSLLDCLRDALLLTGTRAGCEHGVCGTCTVLLEPAGELSVIQDAFCEMHGTQCGYCTAGMVLTAHALLAANPAPSRAEIVEAISGNLCRCTGYGQIIESIELAAERLRQSNAADAMPEAVA